MTATIIEKLTDEVEMSTPWFRGPIYYEDERFVLRPVTDKMKRELSSRYARACDRIRNQPAEENEE